MLKKWGKVAVKTTFISRRSHSEMWFDICLYLFMIAVAIITLYPFLNVLAVALNDATDSVRGGIHIWPRKFTLENFKAVFRNPLLLTAFQNSVLRTVIGTGLGVFCCAMVAYTLSRRDFAARRFISVSFALTLYISGGLIPFYILMRDLHLLNTFQIYILPGLVSPWIIFVVRSYMDGLPYSLQESAKMDGANDFLIFYRIMIPLSLPVLATVALFIAVGQWNSWFDNFLFNGSKDSLTTLQYELMKILKNTSVSSLQDGYRLAEQANQEQFTRVSPQSIRMAITIVATLPILVVYPFLQKYFIQGLTLGAVKS